MKYGILFPVVMTVLLFGMPGAALGDKVVARVEDKKIMQSDIAVYSEKIPDPLKKAFRKKALDDLIDREAFSRLAKKEGLHKEKEFLDKLAKVKAKLLADYFVEKKLKPEISVDDKEIRLYYEKHEDRYNTPEKVKVAHVVTESRKDAESVKKAMEGGKTVKQILKEDFGKHGEIAGQDLGWIGRGDMPPSFVKEAFSLEKGNVGEVVKTRLGFHVIRQTDRREGRNTPIESVRSKIRKTLAAEKLEKRKETYRQSVDIEVFDGR